MIEWMPIGEGVPPIGMPLIITIMDGYRHKRELRYPVYYQKSPYDGNYGFFVHGREDYEIDQEYSQILAWILMPEIWEGEEE